MDISKYRNDPITGKKLARDEIAAEMDRDGIALETIKEELAYSTKVLAREGIARGKRYDHHLRMARMRKIKNRRRAKPNPWNELAEETLRRHYSNPEVKLKDVAYMCSIACGTEVSVSACIGKAYRMELPPRSSKPANNKPRRATQKEQYRDQDSREAQGTEPRRAAEDVLPVGAGGRLRHVSDAH